ncbi:helix-turn-helix domain-containing protein [Roseomonas sp. OT10]|uniref:helix-turn-helix domain-containing protein n=1 Tax=Roseomonas cutis TaxID=2897332 RepID=UPI001E3F489A|nr:helix-turn-helix domain-containing protein [Roseomonas sp. OT10]UFN49830.1 helix-turn-helix domain-containing protein [Roseomonas sp. OT10]
MSHDTDKDTEFGRDLIASLEEAAAILRGAAEPARVHLAPDVPDVRAIRTRMGLTREAFAERFGLRLSAVRDWEQGLRKPDPAARTLLRVIEREPEAVVRALVGE